MTTMRTRVRVRKAAAPRAGYRHRGTVAALCGLLLAASASGALFLPGCGAGKISLEYEPRADLAIVTASSDGGLPSPGDDLCPVFQLFGDGTFLALEEQGSGSVLVRGSFDEAEVEDLLRRIADTGFFELEDEYADPKVYDATYRKIAVGLAEENKAVTVWAMSDVPAFDAAYDVILDFPRGETEPYVPKEGYLVVVSYPLDAAGGYRFLDPGSEVYSLLPEAAVLDQAASTHTAVEVEGATFMRLKECENAQEGRGLYLRQPDSVLVVYPVYEPRTARKPGTLP